MDCASLEDRRMADFRYEVIAPDDKTWKVDLDAAHAAVAASLEKATNNRNEPLIEYYTTKLESIELDQKICSIQVACQKGQEPPTFAEDAMTSRRVVNLGAQLSLALNVFLLVIKVFAAVRTGSTTVLASLVDSILDLFSGSIMVAVGFLYDRSSRELFPAGKARFEPLGTLVFACAMFVAATKLLQECADEVEHIDTIKFEMDVISLLILVVVIVLKTIAAYFCFKFGKGSSTLTALAEDHRNDIMSNVIAVLGFLAAVHITVWADPILALFVTLMILKVWGSQILSQLHALSGHTATPEFLNCLTVIARNHDFRVLQVDTVRAVTSGTGHVVEIDLVLPENMPLKEAHDIGETLQVFLETTSCLNVDRAYVHLDTETNHDPFKHL